MTCSTGRYFIFSLANRERPRTNLAKDPFLSGLAYLSPNRPHRLLPLLHYARFLHIHLLNQSSTLARPLLSDPGSHARPLPSQQSIPGTH